MRYQISEQTPFQSIYNIENNYSLSIQQKTCSAKIKMMMLSEPLNTSDMPHTLDILINFLPSVLTTECFNDQSLPFAQEVKKTEIGHLFEHILLEYMCQLKITKGYRSAVFAGRTRWNWERDPRGLFHISVNCAKKDNSILKDALEMSIVLMNLILHFNRNYNLPYQSYLFAPTMMRKKRGLKNGKKLKKSKPKSLIEKFFHSFP